MNNDIKMPIWESHPLVLDLAHARYVFLKEEAKLKRSFMQIALYSEKPSIPLVEEPIEMWSSISFTCSKEVYRINLNALMFIARQVRDTKNSGYGSKESLTRSL